MNVAQLDSVQGEMSSMVKGMQYGSKSEGNNSAYREQVEGAYEILQELEKEKGKSRLLEQEKETLKKAIKQEQEALLELKKDRMELETRLKTAEDENRKSAEIRGQLQSDLRNLKKSQNELLNKIKESQEFVEMCATFLQKNGLLVNSFISEDPFSP